MPGKSKCSHEQRHDHAELSAGVVNSRGLQAGKSFHQRPVDQIQQNHRQRRWQERQAELRQRFEIFPVKPERNLFHQDRAKQQKRQPGSPDVGKKNAFNTLSAVNDEVDVQTYVDNDVDELGRCVRDGLLLGAQKEIRQKGEEKSATVISGRYFVFSSR